MPGTARTSGICVPLYHLLYSSSRAGLDGRDCTSMMPLGMVYLRGWLGQHDLSCGDEPRRAEQIVAAGIGGVLAEPVDPRAQARGVVEVDLVHGVVGPVADRPRARMVLHVGAAARRVGDDGAADLARL